MERDRVQQLRGRSVGRIRVEWRKGLKERREREKDDAEDWQLESGEQAVCGCWKESSGKVLKKGVRRNGTLSVCCRGKGD